MSYFTNFQINDHIYQIKDSMGVLTTLVIGKNKALLIDTGYGIGNLKEHISTITNLPLIVVASHGHMDHTGGNYQFNEVFIHPLDIELCKLHNSLEWRKRDIVNATNLKILPENFNKEEFLSQKEGNLKVINENHVFDLGDISVTVVNMEGHTKGSIGLLINEDRILVVSDATCPFVWLFLEESTTVSTYIKMLERNLQLPFDNILVGHGAGKLLPRSRMESFLNIAMTIDLKKAVKVSFNNFDNINSYCYTLGKMYDQNDCGIVFDPNKM